MIRNFLLIITSEYMKIKGGEKNNMRKIVLLLLALGLLSMSVVGCGGPGLAGTFVPSGDGPDDNNDGSDLDNGVAEDLPGADEVYENDGSDYIFDGVIILPGEGEDWDPDRVIAEYLSVSGIVVSIEDVDGKLHVKILDSNGGDAILVLSDDTVFLFDDSIEIGDEVTGWYLSNMPMILIYPPQYTIKILAAGVEDGVRIKIDRFHKWEDNTEGFFLSQDGMFAFSKDENTVIKVENGSDFSNGILDGRRIAVVYGISTRSIPEMATADRLIIMFENPVPG